MTVVATAVVETRFGINSYEMDGRTVYDYYDSDEWFETPEEAIHSAAASVDGHIVTPIDTTEGRNALKLWEEFNSPFVEDYAAIAHRLATELSEALDKLEKVGK